MLSFVLLRMMVMTLEVRFMNWLAFGRDGKSSLSITSKGGKYGYALGRVRS